MFGPTQFHNRTFRESRPCSCALLNRCSCYQHLCGLLVWPGAASSRIESRLPRLVNGHALRRSGRLSADTGGAQRSFGADIAGRQPQNIERRLFAMDRAIEINGRARKAKPALVRSERSLSRRSPRGEGGLAKSSATHGTPAKSSRAKHVPPGLSAAKAKAVRPSTAATIVLTHQWLCYSMRREGHVGLP